MLQNELQRAVSCFGEDDFMTLPVVYSPLSSVINSGDAKFVMLQDYLGPVDGCVWRLFEIAYVLDWTFHKRQFADEILRRHLIKSIHVEIQSAFDYLAEAILDIWTSCGMNEKRTFHNLRRWCQNQEIRAKRELEENVVDFIRDCAGFDHINKVRNALVHRGATIRCDQGGLFLVSYQGNNYPETSWLDPRLFNSGYIDARHYFAVYLARLLNFVTAIVPPIASKVGLELGSTFGFDAPTGASSVQRWMEEVIAKLSQNPALQH